MKTLPRRHLQECPHKKKKTPKAKGPSLVLRIIFGIYFFLGTYQPVRI